jgi:mannose-1-phosphate guanylyltransferase
MVPVAGRPLLEHWLDSLAEAGVDEVLLNLHHLPDVVRAYLAGRAGPPDVRTVYEPDLLGSAGTLIANRAWVADEQMFLACYADNLTAFDLSDLITAHREASPAATLTGFRSDNPSAGGVLEVDEAGWLTSFAEKPARPASDLVNAGIYAFHPGVLDGVGGRPPKDIARDLLTGLIGKARVLPIDSYFRDIGTIAAYRLACAEWPVRVLQ